MEMTDLSLCLLIDYNFYLLTLKNKTIMSKRTFQFVITIVGGLGTIATGCVTYFVEDKLLATEIVGAIGAGVTAVGTICSKFVKAEPDSK